MREPTEGVCTSAQIEEPARTTRKSQSVRMNGLYQKQSTRQTSVLFTPSTHDPRPRPEVKSRQVAIHMDNHMDNRS